METEIKAPGAPRGLDWPGEQTGSGVVTAAGGGGWVGVVSVRVPFQEGDCLWQVSFPGIGPCKRKLHAKSYWTSPGTHVWEEKKAGLGRGLN